MILSHVVAAGTTFQCTPVAVYDGDGPIWCAEGPKIRLRGIAARELRFDRGRMIDAGCKPGHPCPDRSGVEARDTLVMLLGGARGTLPTGHVKVSAAAMSCTSYGSGRGDRTAAACTVRGNGDLSCALVRAGVAVRWRTYGGRAVCG